ncbi:helix-turn-helix transcriptional regulator [Clostridium sp. C2-6-12]|uniref:helix-turn-helix transcriptional regulator n=1 Tax=Clostridium sp. C2-6-12 TaxID=2698832 RepID=UPI001369E9FA|nr:helix-turn-helix transcriptional regulator [Clostridium sp. C2-6-12]
MKNKLNSLIQEKNVSIEEISKETGIGRTTLYQTINGKNIPNVEYALKLSKYFCVPLEELFYLDEDK